MISFAVGGQGKIRQFKAECLPTKGHHVIVPIGNRALPLEVKDVFHDLTNGIPIVMVDFGNNHSDTWLAVCADPNWTSMEARRE